MDAQCSELVYTVVNDLLALQMNVRLHLYIESMPFIENYCGDPKTVHSNNKTILNMDFTIAGSCLVGSQVFRPTFEYRTIFIPVFKWCSE